jgi:hypothetical protein
MPLQNRVGPFGAIHAVSERGTCLGNRGILHTSQRQVRYYHKHKAWIICKLDFKGRRRQVMSPGQYTELFFLDEAAALAAGHRPCAECNRWRYIEFINLWRQDNPHPQAKIDDVLHRERFRPYQSNWQQKKQTYTALIDELPFGTFITLDHKPYVVLDNELRPWGFAGYGEPIARPSRQTVVVLTPPSTVRILAAGYRPQLYPEL